MRQKTVVITGVSGSLGEALGRYYQRMGWHVIGVSRSRQVDTMACDELLASPQTTQEDAHRLLDCDPDLILLNAGQIETEIGPKGEPLSESLEAITRINFLFPSLVALEAAKRHPSRTLEIVVIGSIADGSPSCFGPLYHASKIAVHYFVSGVGPILQSANSKVRLRLYRPGVIKGPLSWAPVNRLNRKGYAIRAKRCEAAPTADHVARKIAAWIEDGKQWIGTYQEPISFKLFKYLFALAPDFFYRLQLLGWKKGSKFMQLSEEWNPPVDRFI